MNVNSVFPDKNYFLSDPAGCPCADLSEMTGIMKKEMSFAEYIDIFPTLEISDYYRTDTHWRQEKLLPAAKKLAQALGVNLPEDYTVQTLERPFYGVYYGQAALPLPTEA